MEPQRSYLVCATPRSGSTLVCEALKATGVAGKPEEYFEALRQTGRPRSPVDYFRGVDDPSIFDHLGEHGSEGGQAQSPLWSRTAYDRYLEWTKEVGTTPNGVYGAKMMWMYFGDFVSLVRNVPEYKSVPLAELLHEVFPDLTFVRVQRANKLRQAVSLWKAIQTATWRQEGDQTQADEGDAYARFSRENRTNLIFHYSAIDHLLNQLLAWEAAWDSFFAYTGIRPVLVLYENFQRDIEGSTCNLLEQLGIEAPGDFSFEPRMKKQADNINVDWARRYGELKLGTSFDLVPTVPEAETAAA